MAQSKREQLGQIVIRPPEGMRERIKAAAEANNRSMNAEIVATLEERYPEPPILHAQYVADVMIRYQKAMSKVLSAVPLKIELKDEDIENANRLCDEYKRLILTTDNETINLASSIMREKYLRASKADHTPKE